MAQDSGLTVRQHRRREIELPIEFVVGESHQAQVRFGSSSGAIDQHAVAGVSVDFSSGGLGVSVAQFLPRMCEGTVRVLDPKPVGTKRDGSPVMQVTFEHRVKVRRVQMTEPQPRYFVGLAFVEPDASLDEQLTALFDRVQRAAVGGSDA